jgi:hypothetical protein
MKSESIFPTMSLTGVLAIVGTTMGCFQGGDAESVIEETTGEANGYYCGYIGEDPNGLPLMCPEGIFEGGPCGNISYAGCCDANGDNWWCGDNGMGPVLILEDCP